MVNVPLEQLPLLFKVVLHSCKTSVSKEWPVPRAPPQANHSALGGQDRLQKKEPERPRWRLWGSISSCLQSKENFCLFVCFFNLIFLYIYFTTELNVWPSTWCTCFCVNAADAFPCSLQNVKMFNVTVLSLFRDSSFVFWGRGWEGAEMNISKMLTKTTTSVEKEGYDHPYFFHIFSADSYICLSESKLPFLATELPGKRAHHKGAKWC